ncbi:unnamed protein product [Prunus armeniaca]
MVTASQLVIPHSSIASLVPMVSNVHVKLDDTNYLQWHFQMNLLLECHGILGFVIGSHPCPPQFVVSSNFEEIEAYKVWQLHDKALMLLISTTLSAFAISCVIGSTNAREMWLTLKERFAIITKTSIFLLKTCLYNMKKGSYSIAQYLNHIKDARDQLSCVSVHFADEDIIILALNGLPKEYNTFRCVMQCQESMLSFKEFQCQLLAEEIMLVACHRGSKYHNQGRAASYYPQESRSCNATIPQSVDEIIAADDVLPQATTLHDGKASGSHDEGETGKTIIFGNAKFAGDIPLVTPKLHFDRILHFDLNVVPDIQKCVLANDIDYNATVLLVVPSTIVSFILALAGGFQWKLKHMAQPPGFTETLYLGPPLHGA